MKLYKDLATQFSNSRAFPWKGWEKVSAHIKEQFSKPISVLDLGCGNARFLDFLRTENIEITKYTGLDNSEELLKIAEQKFKGENIEFINADLQSSWEDKISGKYDFICIFGVMHHLESNENRIELLKAAKKILNENGTIFVTYWQFGKFERFTSKAENLGDNNYMLPFNGEEAARFCHFTDETEAQLLEEKSGVTVTKSFYSDGSDNSLNLYRLYK